MHKRTEKFTTSEEAVKGTDEVHKRTDNIITNEDVDKGTEKLEDIKEAVVTIRSKNSDKFEGQSKGYIGWFNLDSDFKKRKFLQLNQTSIRKFMKRILKVKMWNRIKRFSYRLLY